MARKTKKQLREELKSFVQDEFTKGNLVLLNLEDLSTVSIEGFIKSNVESMLYDLNKIEPFILARIDDPRWINDYATSKVIRALKAKIDELEKSNT